MVPPKPVRWQATQWNSQSHIKILVLGIFFLLRCLIGGCELFHPFRPTTRARTDLTMYLVTAADLPAGWSEEATSPYGADGTFLRGNDLHNILRSFVTDAAVPRRVTHTIKEYESTIVAQEAFDLATPTQATFQAERGGEVDDDGTTVSTDRKKKFISYLSR